MTVEEEYREKLRTAEEIADRFESGMVCAAGLCLGEPTAIVKAVGEAVRKKGLKNIKHHHYMSVYPSPFFDPELKDSYSEISWHSVAGARKAFEAGSGDIMPAYFRDSPVLHRDGGDIDVFYVTVSPMDEHGYFSLGTSAADSRAWIEKAAHVYVEVNPHMPRTFGDQHLHISEVELLCENDAPLAATGAVKIDETSRKIGEMIAAEIPDGATLQLGIGGIPDAVGLFLKDKKDLGIHTELFGDSMMELVECGAVTNRAKPFNKGKSVTTFAFGSEKLYKFLDNNVGVGFYSVDYTNDPKVIAAHDNFVSINSCIEVDLWGQVAAETIGARFYSGTGGQVDFVRGARESKGGRSYIAMPSTAQGGKVSRIRPHLSSGSIVTTSKNDVDCIVTEFGVARLCGKTAKERVQELLHITHPDFRDELLFEARNMNLI